MLRRFDPALTPAAFVSTLEAPRAPHSAVDHAALAHLRATAMGASAGEAAACAVSAFAAHMPRAGGKKGRRVRAAIDAALQAAGYGAAGARR